MIKIDVNISVIRLLGKQFPKEGTMSLSFDPSYSDVAAATSSGGGGYSSGGWSTDAAQALADAPHAEVGSRSADYSSSVSYGDGQPRAVVGERSADTIASASVPTSDTATEASHHHGGGVLAAIVNLVEVVVNIVLPSGSSPSTAPTAPPGQMIDPGTGQPFTPPTYGKPDSHW